MVDIPKSLFGLILVLLCVLAAILAYKATHNAHSKFDLASAFLDAEGKTSMARIGQFTALAVSTWGFAFLTVEGKLSEAYFTMYVMTWVGNGLGNKWLEKPKETT